MDELKYYLSEEGEIAKRHPVDESGEEYDGLDNIQIVNELNALQSELDKTAGDRCRAQEIIIRQGIELDTLKRAVKDAVVDMKRIEDTPISGKHHYWQNKIWALVFDILASHGLIAEAGGEGCGR